MTTKRIEALADCIFAFAMTLLVINLKVPDLHIKESEKIKDILLEQWYNFDNYILSFILLAVFWKIHHWQFHFIKRTDHLFIWINMFILMFIVLTPLTTSLVASHEGTQITNIIFDLNLFIVGVLFFLNWSYATHGYRLIDHELEHKFIERGRRRALIVPLIALFAIILTFLSPRWSGAVYLLIPLILLKKEFR